MEKSNSEEQKVQDKSSKTETDYDFNKNKNKKQTPSEPKKTSPESLHEPSNLINPETGQPYPEQLTPKQIEEQEQNINIEGLPLEIDITNNEDMTPEKFTLSRKDGLGTSDSSVVLGVNPYTKVSELIKEKLRTYVTEEEKMIGQKSAVMKGNHLEPLVIYKFQEYFKQHTVKPLAQYQHKDFPFLKINFDGVTGSHPHYFPVETKIVTAKGERRYDETRAMFNEWDGFKPLPEDVSERNWSIQTKAAFYGVPPYYYTQLQQQILGLGSQYGYLAILHEREWKFYVHFVWRDNAVLNALIIEANKVWNKIETLRGSE